MKTCRPVHWPPVAEPRLSKTHEDSLRSAFDPHGHHQVVQAVSAPAAQPANLPIVEARPDRDRRPEAKELGFRASS
jgi:hypothetical protein